MLDAMELRIEQSIQNQETFEALKTGRLTLAHMNKKQKKDVNDLMQKLNKELEAADEISNTLAEAPAGGLNDCDVEAEYEALEKSLKDEGVEESKGDDATTTLPALPNVPTMPPVALPPPPGTKAAKSCAA